MANVNKTSRDGWHSLMFAVIGGHIDVVDFLIYETKVDLMIKDNHSMTAKEIAQK